MSSSWGAGVVVVLLLLSACTEVSLDNCFLSVVIVDHCFCLVIGWDHNSQRAGPTLTLKYSAIFLTYCWSVLAAGLGKQKFTNSHGLHVWGSTAHKKLSYSNGLCSTQWVQHFNTPQNFCHNTAKRGSELNKGKNENLAQLRHDLRPSTTYFQ